MDLSAALQNNIHLMCRYKHDTAIQTIKRCNMFVTLNVRGCWACLKHLFEALLVLLAGRLHGELGAEDVAELSTITVTST